MIADGDGEPLKVRGLGSIKMKVARAKVNMRSLVILLHCSSDELADQLFERRDRKQYSNLFFFQLVMQLRGKVDFERFPL